MRNGTIEKSVAATRDDGSQVKRELSAFHVFFAYIGVDIVATTAEETRRLQREMPIAIIGSLAIVTVINMAVALVITGMARFKALADEAHRSRAATGANGPAVLNGRRSRLRGRAHRRRESSDGGRS
jgi:amino acid permease